MKEPFPERATMLNKATRLTESSGLAVPARDCETGDHRLDPVVTGSGYARDAGGTL